LTSGSRTFAVVGATGSVGRSVASALQHMGHRVRPIARRAGLSLDDADALTRAFADVDGAFVMIPFDLGAFDLHRREDEIGARLAAAISDAAVPRVVFLSGTSAHLRERAGSATGAAMMEVRLDHLRLLELVHLRGAFFMENLLQSVGQMAAVGTFRWPFAADRPTPMVAAGDVGKRAAALLVEPFSGQRVQELLGPRDYTMAQAVSVLGAAVGRPQARYIQVPYEQARHEMIRAGLSPSFADAVMQTARSFNDGEVWAKEARSPRNTTATTLEQFAAEIFAPAYRAEVDRMSS
jgi:uncharacterized protein YbjT (DUF2867 family)